MKRKSLAAAASACVLAGAGAAVAIPAASAATSGRTVLSGTAAAAAIQSKAVGAVSASSQVNFELVLNLRDQAGAEALVKAISSPSSAQYRHYITAAQWEAQFSPTAAEVSQAEQWLTSEGFTVGSVAKDRITISASGTAAQVESAFGTTLDNYTVDGHTLREAATNLSVPSSLAGVVVGAMGINQHLATPADAGDPGLASSVSSTSATSASSTNPFPPAPAAFEPHPPCGSYYGAAQTTVTPPFAAPWPSTVPDVVCGYVPGQLRSAYGLTAANTGAGETVAIVDAYGSATIDADATKYFATEAPSEPFSTANFTQLDATPFDDEAECAASSWLVEQAIDVEAVHAMAPDAHILYVGAQDCINGLFAADQAVIDGGLANVVTNSWGDTGGDLLDDISYRTAFDDLFMLADSTGITVQYSSGDFGDNFQFLGVSAADYPASSPFVTAVGGTELEIGASGQRTAEYGWLTGRSWLCTPNLVGAVQVPLCTAATEGQWLPATFDAGSGGFTSYNYTQPFYQAGVVPASLALRNAAILGPVPTRVVPDISLEAAPDTGFLIGVHQTFPIGNGIALYSTTRYGGTSLASPLLAGVVADADQAAGQPLGFLNPTLYEMDRADPSSIYDVLPSGNAASFRADFAGPLGVGFTYANGTSVPGTADSYREINYNGLETYCDETGNCETRPETQSAAPGYDSLTGLGSPGTNFIGTLASF